MNFQRAEAHLFERKAMRTSLRMFVACGVTALGLAASVAWGAADLVDGGKAAGRIVLPEKATAAETFAAQEIQTFVQKMSGAKLPIVAAGAAGAGPAILVGNQPGNKAVIDELNAKHGDTIDAFGVVGKGDRLSLVGRSADSTIWAAWQWLNDQGVEWVMPGPHGMHVPQKATVQITDVHDIEAPSMMIRGGGYSWARGVDVPKGAYDEVHGVQATKLFAMRMRFNQNAAFEEKDRFVTLGAGHSYAYYLPPSKYFSAHPEWFAVKNGKRYRGKQWQVCFTNKEGAAQFAKNIEPQLKRWLAAGVPIERIRIAVSPNDGTAMCECPNCRKLIDRDGSATSLVTNFCNMVTEALRKDFPKAQTRFYAYENYSTPPDHVKPVEGVIPEIVFWTSASSFAANSAHPMFSEQNHKYRDGYQGWEKISTAVTSHTYYGHYNWFTPWPMTTQMAHDLPILGEDPKCEGMYSELHLEWGTQGLNLWLYPKLMWNAKLDVKAAVKAYCQAAYGPAAGAIEAYYQAVQDSMDKQGYVNGRSVEIPRVLTAEVMSKVNGYIAQAEGMLDQMDPDTRWRTELVCRAWQASAQFAEAIQTFNTGSGQADRKKILALCDQVDQFAKSDLGKWAFEYDRVVVPNIKTVNGALKTDLEALPAGENVFSDRFNMGGAIKFFGTLSGFRSGLWGYSLATNAGGTVELPLKAAAGHKITSASVKWSISKPENYSGTLSVVSDKGGEKVLSKDVKEMTQGVTIPADDLGGTIRLKLALLNTNYEGGTALTGVRVDAKVE
jgi:hypothetical protein